MELEDIDKQQLIIKLKETRRQLDIKTIAHAQVKNELQTKNQILNKFKKIIRNNHHNLLEELECTIK